MTDSQAVSMGVFLIRELIFPAWLSLYLDSLCFSHVTVVYFWLASEYFET